MTIIAVDHGSTWRVLAHGREGIVNYPSTVAKPYAAYVTMLNGERLGMGLFLGSFVTLEEAAAAICEELLGCTVTWPKVGQ